MKSWSDYLTAFLKVLPALIQAGTEIEPLAAKLVNSIRSNDEPTAADLAELDALEKKARDELQAPLDA